MSCRHEHGVFIVHKFYPNQSIVKNSIHDFNFRNSGACRYDLINPYVSLVLLTELCATTFAEDELKLKAFKFTESDQIVVDTKVVMEWVNLILNLFRSNTECNLSQGLLGLFLHL